MMLIIAILRTMHNRPFRIISLFLLLFLGLVTQVSAFGVSPPWINQSNLVPGSHFEKEIFLLRANDAEDLLIEAEFDLPEEIRDWFSIDKGEKFIIPAGVKKFPIIVTIDIPDKAELGVYKGFLRVRTVPEAPDLESTGVSIAIGARIDINLTVGDNVIVDFEVHGITILDIRENEPAQVLVKMENKGNVNTALDRATFDLYDKYGEVRLGFSQIEELPRIQSFKTEDFVIDFDLPLTLSIGEYWAEAKVFKDGVVVGQQKTVFNVTEKRTNTPLYVAVVVVLAALASVSFMVRKKYSGQSRTSEKREGRKKRKKK